MSESVKTDTGEGGELIAFNIGAQEFCVSTTAVREIRGWTPATALPHAPAFVLGVVNLRGAVLPIVDLAMRLGFPPTATNGASRHHRRRVRPPGRGSAGGRRLRDFYRQRGTDPADARHRRRDRQALSARRHRHGGPPHRRHRYREPLAVARDGRCVAIRGCAERACEVLSSWDSKRRRAIRRFAGVGPDLKRRRAAGPLSFRREPRSQARRRAPPPIRPSARRR